MTMLLAVLMTALLFLAMMLFYEVGYRLNAQALKRDLDEPAKGSGAVQAAVFALLGLVIAFTFSGAGARFEARRALITQEANEIGTAYLRVDLLAPDAQPEVRAVFRRYAQLRASPPDLSEPTAMARWDARTAALQETIWTLAVRASQRPESASQATMLMLPALNGMIDITTTRRMATRNHPPFAIFIMMGVLTLAASLLAGREMAARKVRSWLQPIAFAAVISFSIYLIIDLEFPRAGLIQVEDADRVLAEVRQGMN